MNFNQHIIRVLPNEYAGSEKKRTVILDNNKKYMLKFPDPTREKKKDISYINNTISEHIGCKIAECIGLPVQKTILGEYVDNGKKKIACACEDLRSEGITMHPIEILELGSLDNLKQNASFETAFTIIEKLDISNKEEIKENYIKMFILDTLISNTDRHNGNWAVLYDGFRYLPCPIYDCGSSLFPLLSERDMTEDVSVLVMGTFSALSDSQGRRINYHKFFAEAKNEDVNLTLRKFVKNINIDKISSIIENIPYISEKRKQFYKNVVRVTYEKTLIYSLEKQFSQKGNIDLDSEELFDFYKKNIKKIKELPNFECCKIYIDNRRLTVEKISDNKALCFNENGICNGVISLRSNSNDVRKTILALQNIEKDKYIEKQYCEYNSKMDKEEQEEEEEWER